MRRVSGLFRDLIGLLISIGFAIAMATRPDLFKRPIDPSTGLRRPFTTGEHTFWTAVALAGVCVTAYRLVSNARKSRDEIT